MITMDRVEKLVDGNPGALRVVIQAMEENITLAISGLERLERGEIRGSEIWILFKDICKSDTTKFLSVVNARPMEDLKQSIYMVTHPGELDGSRATAVFMDEFMAEEGDRDV